MREEELLRLEAATRDIGVPLLIARSYGLMGYLRVRLPGCWVSTSVSHPCDVLYM